MVDIYKLLNTLIQAGILIIMIITIIIGREKLGEVNTKLDELSLKRINTTEMLLIDENGDVYGIITPKGIHLRSGAEYRVGDLNINEYIK